VVTLHIGNADHLVFFSNFIIIIIIIIIIIMIISYSIIFGELRFYCRLTMTMKLKMVKILQHTHTQIDRVCVWERERETCVSVYIVFKIALTFKNAFHWPQLVVHTLPTHTHTHIYLLMLFHFVFVVRWHGSTGVVVVVEAAL